MGGAAPAGRETSAMGQRTGRKPGNRQDQGLVEYADGSWGYDVRLGSKRVRRKLGSRSEAEQAMAELKRAWQAKRRKPSPPLPDIPPPEPPASSPTTRPSSTRPLTVKEVSERIGLSTSTICAMVRAGELRAHRRGKRGKIFVQQDEVDAWLARASNKPEPKHSPILDRLAKYNTPLPRSGAKS